jgi:hypothetical protein
MSIATGPSFLLQTVPSKLHLNMRPVAAGLHRIDILALCHTSDFPALTPLQNRSVSYDGVSESSVHVAVDCENASGDEWRWFRSAATVNVKAAALDVDPAEAQVLTLIFHQLPMIISRIAISAMALPPRSEAVALELAYNTTELPSHALLARGMCDIVPAAAAAVCNALPGCVSRAACVTEDVLDEGCSTLQARDACNAAATNGCQWHAGLAVCISAPCRLGNTSLAEQCGSPGLTLQNTYTVQHIGEYSTEGSTKCGINATTFVDVWAERRTPNGYVVLLFGELSSGQRVAPLFVSASWSEVQALVRQFSADLLVQGTALLALADPSGTFPAAGTYTSALQNKDDITVACACAPLSVLLFASNDRVYLDQSDIGLAVSSTTQLPSSIDFLLWRSADLSLPTMPLPSQAFRRGVLVPGLPTSDGGTRYKYSFVDPLESGDRVAVAFMRANDPHCGAFNMAPVVLDERRIWQTTVGLPATVSHIAVARQRNGEAEVSWSYPRPLPSLEAGAPLAYVVEVIGARGGAAKIQTPAYPAVAERTDWREKMLATARLPSASRRGLGSGFYFRPCSLINPSVEASALHVGQPAWLPMDLRLSLTLNASVGALLEGGGTVNVEVVRPVVGLGAPAGTRTLPALTEMAVPPTNVLVRPSAFSATVTWSWAAPQLSGDASGLGVNIRVWRAGPDGRMNVVDQKEVVADFSASDVPLRAELADLDTDTQYALQLAGFYVDSSMACQPALRWQDQAEDDCPTPPLEGAKVVGRWSSLYNFTTRVAVPTIAPLEVVLPQAMQKNTSAAVQVLVPRNVRLQGLVAQLQLVKQNGNSASELLRQSVVVVQIAGQGGDDDARRRREDGSMGGELMTEGTGTALQFVGTLVNLRPNALYNVRAALATSGGVGPFSEIIPVTTAEGLPGPPQWLEPQPASTSVSLRWRQPLEPNGIITLYTVFYRPVTGRQSNTPFLQQSTPVMEAVTQQLEVRNLKGGGVFEFAIAAHTKIGMGEMTALDEVTLNESGASTESSALTGATLAGIATAVVVIIIILMAFFLIRGRKQSSYNQQLEKQLQNMKLGVEELTAKVGG